MPATEHEPNTRTERPTGFVRKWLRRCFVDLPSFVAGLVGLVLIVTYIKVRSKAQVLFVVVRGRISVALIALMRNRYLIWVRHNWIAVKGVDTKLSTELAIAVESGNENNIEILLARGARPNALSLAGTPLLVIAVYRNELQVVESLLRYGANPNVRLRFGSDTALMIAVKHNQTDIVRCLLEHGCDIDSCDWTRVTPLMQAAHRGFLEIVELLLDAGADPLCDSAENQCAYGYARLAQQTEVMNLLDDRRKVAAKQRG